LPRLVAGDAACAGVEGDGEFLARSFDRVGFADLDEVALDDFCWALWTLGGGGWSLYTVRPCESSLVQLGGGKRRACRRQADCHFKRVLLSCHAPNRT